MSFSQFIHRGIDTIFSTHLRGLKSISVSVTSSMVEMFLPKRCMKIRAFCSDFQRFFNMYLGGCKESIYFLFLLNFDRFPRTNHR